MKRAKGKHLSCLAASFRLLSCHSLRVQGLGFGKRQGYHAIVCSQLCQQRENMSYLHTLGNLAAQEGLVFDFAFAEDNQQPWQMQSSLAKVHYTVLRYDMTNSRV